MYAKAAKALLTPDAEAKFSEEPKKIIEDVGVKLIKELETATEKDKTMANLKGKIKEIKKIIEM